MAASTWLSENFQQRIYREAVEHLKDALAPCVADEQELTDLMEEVIDAQQQGQPDKAVELLKNRAGAALWPSIEPYWVHLQDASTFNIRATPQMRRWLFEVKKLTPVKSTNAKEKGFPSIPWERVENLPPEVQKQYQPSTDKQTLKILGQGDATIQVRAAK
jgi:hypothetical protein